MHGTFKNLEITGDGSNYKAFNALMALLDSLYLPGESTKEERDALMKEIMAFYNKTTYETSILEQVIKNIDKFTDNDIKAVQQAAIWYFTNHEDAKFSSLTKDGGQSVTGLLYYKDSSTSYKPLTEYGNQIVENGDAHTQEGDVRNVIADLYFRMLVKEAKENASKYDESAEEEVGNPIKIETETLQGGEPENGRYKLGPIKLTKQNSKTYTISIEVKNSETKLEKSDYKFVDAEGNELGDVQLVDKEFYISIPTNKVNDIKVTITVKYDQKTIKEWEASNDNTVQPLVEITTEPKEENKELTFLPKGGFDLSLRKYVTKIGNDAVPDSRTPVPEVTETSAGASVKYKHRKDGVPAKKDDIITYEIAIYNEGKKKGRATKIVDQLPTGLEFVEVKSDNFEVESYNKDTDNRLTLKRKDSNKKNLNEYTGGTNLDSEIVEITCKVTAESDKTSGKVLTNVAWIAEAWNEDDKETIVSQKIEDSDKADIDSQPGTNPGNTVNKDNMSDYTGDSGNKKELDDPKFYYKGQQDDDDFEKLVIQPKGFDLRLKKFVSEKNGEKVADRITDIDVSNLNKLDSNGNIISLDADIKKNEAPVTVQKGDILTYTFRVYNEGMVDGYAAQITESIPDGLEFIWSEKKDAELEADTTLTPDEKEAIKFNQEHYWTISKYNEAHDKVTEITTDFLSKENETTPGSNLIPAFGSNDGTKTKNDLKFKDVAVKLRVIADEITGESIRNEAAITKETDKDNTPIDEDRDSNPNDWVKYEDDEDYDEVTLNALDLALRKFIVAISEDENVEDSEYMKNGDGTYTREPKVDTSKLNKKDENGNKITTAVYEQSKDPVIIGPNYTIIYMLRVYNEGDVDAYAGEVKDHLPPNLEFVDGEFNKKYGWTVSDNGRTVTTKYLSGDEWIIKKAIKDAEGNVTDLDFVDVPIMCKVSANVKSGENITNIADISEYLDPNKDPAPDRDSEKDDVKLPDDKDLPNYDEKNSDHQDDDNYEKVVIKTFDLSLKKWTTQAIVIDNGKQTVTQTGHSPYEEPEQIVKVEIKQSKLNTVTIKFRYSIRVTNEGDIEGYAKEITDYIPNGFKFVPEDNPGWTDKGNNQVSTRLLENTLLQPGQYADVDIVLTWINSESGLGAVSKNTAEITEDYNRYNIPDKDSTPGNRKDGEDDQDNAQVLLSIKTGQVRIYFSLIFTVLITTAVGIVLIKKYVL